MNNVIKQLLERKSMRAYEKQEIPQEDVQAILAAAVQAPTAGNMTLWTAIHVTDQKKKDALAVSCDNQPFIAKAPLVLVFCADYKRWFDLFKTIDLGEELRRPGEGDFLLAMSDTVIAAQSAVVAADALGYGSCYIGDIMENCEAHRALLKLPSESEKMVAISAIAQQGMNVARTEKYIQELLTKEQKMPQRVNVGLFLNNLSQSLTRIQQSGIPAVSERRDTENEIVLTITIPK